MTGFSTSTNGKYVIQANDLSVFYGNFRAIKNVNLQIHRNKITAIIGPSGCGKSTMLRAFNRMNELVPTAHATGEVIYDGKNIYDSDVDPVEVRRRVGMVFQKPNPFPKSIYDNFHDGPRPRRLPGRVRIDATDLYESEGKADRGLHFGAVRMSGKRVLFLCTGNSCRSQMAEGLVNHFLGDHWRADSAGTKPVGCVHPLAVEAMAELGIDIADGRSKSVDEFRDVSYDAVITVCDDAAENCPLWLGEGRVVHISFPDPASAIGRHSDRMAVFRGVRDGIREKVLYFLEQEDDGGDANPSS
jgi:arsenate reductase